MVSIGHQTAVDAVRPALAEIDFNLDGVVDVRWPVVGSAAGSRRLLVSTLPTMSMNCVAPCSQGATQCSVSRANRMSGAFTSVADYRPSSKVCTAFAASEHRPEQALNKTEHTYVGEILARAHRPAARAPGRTIRGCVLALVPERNSPFPRSPFVIRGVHDK
jgi:hypothetical protein